MTGDPQYCDRVDLVKAKNLITKKLGSVQAEKYFNLIKRYFSKKLDRCDFQKLCIVAIGRDNISLHNFFIRSILKNSKFCATPPPELSKPKLLANSKPANGYQSSCMQFLSRCNLIPKHPRRGRTPVVHEKKKRPSPLGPHGKPETLVCQEQLSSIISKEDGEDVNQSAGFDNKRPPITAPFGVQYRAKATQKHALIGNCRSNSELPDTVSLMNSLIQKLKDEGVTVSLDFAKVLNLSLDVYLKNAFQPCLEVAKAQDRAQALLGTNGMVQQYPRHVQMPSSNTYASTADLRTAMELNTTVRGNNWSLNLETVTRQQDLEMEDVDASGIQLTSRK